VVEAADKEQRRTCWRPPAEEEAGADKEQPTTDSWLEVVVAGAAVLAAQREPVETAEGAAAGGAGGGRAFHRIRHRMPPRHRLGLRNVRTVAPLIPQET
jgi:hypothetical protein